MKTFTSVLTVNRLLTSLFTCIFLVAAANVMAFSSIQNETVSNIDNTVSNEVEFASLSATATEKTVFINWVTAEERNNSHFEVERSTDQKEFTTVAMVLDGFAAKGTGKTYKFKEDAGDISKGKTVYYRLKQIDTDNKVHYSKVMAVQMNTKVIMVPAQSSQQIATVHQLNKMLSKQSITSPETNDVLTGRSYGLSAGTSYGPVFMTESELNYPKLTFA